MFPKHSFHWRQKSGQCKPAAHTHIPSGDFMVSLKKRDLSVCWSALSWSVKAARLRLCPRCCCCCCCREQAALSAACRPVLWNKTAVNASHYNLIQEKAAQGAVGVFVSILNRSCFHWKTHRAADWGLIQVTRLRASVHFTDVKLNE